jgi:hypothetical protein
MKSPRLVIAAFLAACFMSAAALAADPNGNWKWTVEFNGQSFDSAAKIEVKDGKLTGTLTSPMGEIPITDGTFKDGVVVFTLTRERDGNKFVIKYQGKLEGDAITGSIDFPGFNGGEPMKMDWKASRVKDDKKADEAAKSK